jgi:ATP-dependent DNA helicase RecQ
MTRAKETLSLFERKDVPNPHACLVDGDFLLRRDMPVPIFPSEKILRRRYEIIGMADLFLDYAGRRPASDPVHNHLARLHHGAVLNAQIKGESVGLHDERGHCVVRLSGKACKEWMNLVDSIERISVLAMVWRRTEDSGEDYRKLCQCGEWEVPVVELVFSLSS